MSKITKYYELPESIKSDELQKYFKEYIELYYNKTNEENVCYALSELLELADRQWHTYEVIKDKIKKQLENYIKSIINFENEDVMDYVLYIIPRIGMGDLFRYILQNKNCIYNVNVKFNIEESEKEYGSTVDNPYSGMSY